MQPQLELPTWEKISRIGKGGSGLVFQVRNPESKAIYALKIAVSNDKNGVLAREIALHSKLTHPNIIQYVTAFEIQHFGERIIVPQRTVGEFGARFSVGLVLELANEGDLFEHLKAHYGMVPITTIKKWSRELIGACIYLKENQIVHRDIKLENVLLSNGSVKLTDFDLSRHVDDLKYTKEYIGTPDYLAPEIVPDLRYSYQSDVWALGVLICEMMGVRRPYMGFPNKIVRRSTIPVNPVTVNVFSILTPLFHDDPNLRIPIEKILQLPFFASENNDIELLKYMREQKKEFGNGTRAEFYLYLANKNPTAASMSLVEFNSLYDRLYQV